LPSNFLGSISPDLAPDFFSNPVKYQLTSKHRDNKAKPFFTTNLLGLFFSLHGMYPEHPGVKPP